MSVYTELNEQDCKDLLQQYTIGEYIAHHGILDGVTNSVYQLQTSLGEFILSLYEVMPADDVTLLLTLSEYLRARGLPCPAVMLTQPGTFSLPYQNKCIAICEKIQGYNLIGNATLKQCAAIGTLLAQFHVKSTEFTKTELASANKTTRVNPRGMSWILHTWQRIESALSRLERDFIQYEINELQAKDFSSCHTGWIHADLFKDNVFFATSEKANTEDHIVGIIDFDFCCYDYYLIDIAVAINEWSLLADGMIDSERQDALLAAYQHIRPLSSCEKESLPMMLRFAALRFYLSRLQDYLHYANEKNTGILVKDPNWFANILKQLKAR